MGLVMTWTGREASEVLEVLPYLDLRNGNTGVHI